MPLQLLMAAREQAERSEPAVRAAALLHIARALLPFDQVEAVRALETGIGRAQEIPEEARSIVLGEAAYLAAAVSPEHALPLYAAFGKRDDPWGGSVIRLVNVMATHGHAAEAIAYLNDPLPGDRFPLSMVNNIAAACRDDGTRLDLLRSAIHAWRDPARAYFGGFGSEAFVGFFARCWTLLPREEALRTVREITEWILQVTDAHPRGIPVTGNPNDPEFTSERQYLLFHILPVLHRLDPELTDTLLETNPQLAVAVRRFPFGMESVRAEIQGGGVCEDFIMIGTMFGTTEDPQSGRFIPITEALANDFEEAFQEAFHRYANDSDPESPNEAPKECWPSAQEFRNILFKAGRHQGPSAEKYLDRIPDPDLRLFAQIELCASLAGLPQTGETTIYPKPRVPRRRHN
jgi:hypothetical protein